MNKLPVIETVKQAYRLTFGNWRYAFRISWAWMIISILVGFGFSYQIGSMIENISSLQVLSVIEWLTLSFIFILTTAIALASVGSIAVAWHKLILKDERIDNIYNLRIDIIICKYVFYYIAIPIICFGILFLSWLFIVYFLNLYAFMQFISIILIPLLVFVSLRMAIILPAISIDYRKLTLEKALSATESNNWRIFGGMLLVTFPFIFIAVFIENLTGALFQQGIILTIASIISGILLWLMGFVFLSYLSLMFRFFVPPEKN